MVFAVHFSLPSPEGGTSQLVSPQRFRFLCGCKILRTEHLFTDDAMQLCRFVIGGGNPSGRSFAGSQPLPVYEKSPLIIKPEASLPRLRSDKNGRNYLMFYLHLKNEPLAIVRQEAHHT